MAGNSTSVGFASPTTPISFDIKKIMEQQQQRATAAQIAARTKAAAPQTNALNNQLLDEQKRKNGLGLSSGFAGSNEDIVSQSASQSLFGY